MNALASTTNSLNYIQITTAVLSVLGIFFVDFNTTHIIIAIISFYLYSIIGISLMLHRYYTHKSFEFKFDWLRKIFTLIAILASRGSPLGWVYIHRYHHSKSDTQDDPHSPSVTGFKIFKFFDHMAEKKVNKFLVKDLVNKEQLFISQYYVGIILAFVFLLALIDLSLVYFVYILPVFLTHISQVCFNYFAHKSGYRNVKTKDKSTNNILLWPFILGDAWHNNHHANAAKLNTKIKWWEWDPIASFVKVIEK